MIDQPIDDEAHATFGGTEASGIRDYDGTAIIEEVIEKRWDLTVAENGGLRWSASGASTRSDGGVARPNG